MGKRLLDTSVSLLLLIFFLPLFLAVAFFIKLEDGGTIFYRGIRVGRCRKPFQMLKFRTMVPNSEGRGPSSTSQDDPRITSIGRFLRRFKLDELPQLLNVLRGEMSLVGPRPQVEWAVALYSSEERALLRVKPGITDYASLKFRHEGELLRGSADPDRAYLEKIAPEKIRLGLEYVYHHNMLVDLKILLATAGALIGIDPNWCIPRVGCAQKDAGVLRGTSRGEPL